MLAFYITATVLTVIGSAFSLLRSESTIDYYRTIARDGRNDPVARRILVGYYVGLCAVAIGGSMIIGGVIYNAFID